MKRSPQDSVKSSSVSSELQSINTAGRVFSQEGRGATDGSNRNSKGTLIKRHNINIVHKKESSVPADKPLPRGLNYAATDRLVILKFQ